MAEQRQPATARQLVEMVTSTAAAIAGLDDPWENVVEVEPAWVKPMLLDVSSTGHIGRPTRQPHRPVFGPIFA